MIVKITLEKEDFAVLHDTVYDLTGIKYTDSELQTVWDALPKDIQHFAVMWGTNDTEVREKIHIHLTKKLGVDVG